MDKCLILETIYKHEWMMHKYNWERFHKNEKLVKPYNRMTLSSIKDFKTVEL